MPCIELTEELVEGFITEGKVVLKGYGDNCGFCTKFAPVVDKLADEMTDIRFAQIKIDIHPKQPYTPSAFKRKYMKQDKSEAVMETIPVLFVFENGEMKYRHFGMMDEEATRKFILTGEEPVQAPNKQQRLGQLYAMKGESVTMLEVHQNRLQTVNKELEQLLGLTKAG